MLTVLERVATDLIRAYLIYALFYFGRIMHQEDWKAIRRILVTLGIAGFLALGAATDLGTHFIEEDYDGLFSRSGYSVQDWNPTEQQREHEALRVGLLVAVPMMVGAFTKARPR
jgi:hypothetical protein